MEEPMLDEFPCSLKGFLCLSMLFDGNSLHGTCVTGPVVKTLLAGTPRVYGAHTKVNFTKIALKGI